MFARICLIIGGLGVLSSLLAGTRDAGGGIISLIVFAPLAFYGGYRIYQRRRF